MNPILKLSSYILIFLAITFSLSSYGQSVADIFNEGKESYNNGEYYDAIDLFDRIILDDPYHYASLYQKSYCYYHLEEYKKALETIELAHEYEPLNNKYYYIKAQCFDKLKKYKIAEDYLNLALLYSTDNPYYYSHRGAMLMEQRRYKEALSDYNNAIAYNSTSYGLFYNRGIAKSNLKNYKGACADWQHGKAKSKACEKMFFYKCTNYNVSELPKVSINYTDFIKPKFDLGTYEDFYYYLTQKYYYPENALVNDKQGMVVVAFTLTHDGKIEEVETLVSISRELDSAVVNLIELSADLWTPAKLNGENVNHRMVLPFSFKINEDKSVKSASLQYINENNEQSIDELFSMYKRAVRLNPFNIELNKKYSNFLNSNGLSDSTYNTNWYKALNKKNVELLQEIVSGENFLKIYFDSTWQITNKSNAKYYRISKWEYSFYSGKFKDYTIDGKLYATGYFLSGRKSGEFKYYYPNGNIKAEIFFNYSRPENTWRFYYENNTLKYAIQMEPSDFVIRDYYDSLGNSKLDNGSGKWEMTYYDYTGINKIKVEGSLKNYNKDKTWRFYLNNEIQADEYFVNGKFKSGTYYTNNGEEKINESIIQNWIFYPVELLRTDEVIISNVLNSDDYNGVFAGMVRYNN